MSGAIVLKKPITGEVVLNSNNYTALVYADGIITSNNTTIYIDQIDTSGHFFVIVGTILYPNGTNYPPVVTIYNGYFTVQWIQFGNNQPPSTFTSKYTVFRR